MKPNDQNNYSREVQREVHTDPVTNAHSTTTRTTETVKNVDDSKKAAYHDGYVHGRVLENSQQSEIRRERENDTAARGLLLGIILTSLVGLVLGTVYFLNQRNEAPTPAAVPSPAQRAIQPSPSPSVIRSTERETTIIERAVPVPQPSPETVAPASPEPSTPPDINITVPNSQTQQPPSQPSPAPAASPAPSAPDINITVPNSVNQQAPTPAEPAARTSPAPSANQSDDASQPGIDSETNTQIPNKVKTNEPSEPANSSDAGSTTTPGSKTGAGASSGSAE